jgi:predicted aconitase
MFLSEEEREMLDGRCGRPIQISMEILVGLGECFGAEKMIPVSSTHLLSTFGAIGKGGAQFIKEMGRGSQFAVFTDTNPLTIDPWLWKELGVSEEFVREELALNGIFSEMGAFLCNTCTPYLIGHTPLLRQHVAWNESSAIVFANSVLGARTNREGGPSAIAAGLTGRVPEYGYHLDEERYGTFSVFITAKLNSLHDYSALGYFLGKVAGERVPVLTGIPLSVTWDELKHLGAAAATSGSVALFHAVGVTPEAPSEEVAFGPKGKGHSEATVFGEKERQETEVLLSAVGEREIDLTILGCPHASITEIREIVRLLSGRKVKLGAGLWITTSRVVNTYAELMGYVDVIEGTGARVVCNACPAGLAVRISKKGLAPRTVATNSAKLTYYLAGTKRVSPFFGSTERCIEAVTRKG